MATGLQSDNLTCFQELKLYTKSVLERKLSQYTNVLQHLKLHATYILASACDNHGNDAPDSFGLKSKCKNYSDKQLFMI